MKTSDFDFILPQELIAQQPLAVRDSSRLLVLDKNTGALAHENFKDLPKYLQAGDVLVLNNSRVLPARLFGSKINTGAKIEVLLLRPVSNGDCWEVLVRPGKRVKPGTEITFGGGLLRAQVLSMTKAGIRIIKFVYQGDFNKILDLLGEMPLPPYIQSILKDKERYQTIYSKDRGSVAAPTAGLHFTPDLLQSIEKLGVEIVEIMLHVGLGTFRPVQTENILEHEMHSEFFKISPEAAKIINQAKADGRRIIAVGTTTTRALESAFQNNSLQAGEDWTDIFIYPGYKYQVVDCLLTNFHLPQSTLIMLVSAFAGKESVLRAYQQAIECQYRFFSFGDAMLII